MQDSRSLKYKLLDAVGLPGQANLCEGSSVCGNLRIRVKETLGDHMKAYGLVLSPLWQDLLEKADVADGLNGPMTVRNIHRVAVAAIEAVAPNEAGLITFASPKLRLSYERQVRPLEFKYPLE